jgi:hypothetical protein
MTPLAQSVLSAATKALAEQDDAPHSARILREYRGEARAVAIAVLVALGGEKGKPGLLPFKNTTSQQILELADEIEEAGEQEE